MRFSILVAEAVALESQVNRRDLTLGWHNTARLRGTLERIIRSRSSGIRVHTLAYEMLNYSALA